MRIPGLILAAILIATPALAAEVSVSRQTYELTTMFGSPPPPGAVKLEDKGGGTWLYDQGSRLMLTGETSAPIMKWATFDLGAYESWAVIGPGKGGKGIVVEAMQGGQKKTLTLDLKALHTKSKLKYSVQ